MAGFGYNRPHRVKEAAVHKYVRRDTPSALINYHYVQPMPRAVLPSRLAEWCTEHCQYGWLIQFPRKGVPSFKDTVLIFEDIDDLTAFRDQYCYDDRYHKRPHEADWMDAMSDNE